MTTRGILDEDDVAALLGDDNLDALGTTRKTSAAPARSGSGKASAAPVKRPLSLCGLADAEKKRKKKKAGG